MPDAKVNIVSAIIKSSAGAVDLKVDTDASLLERYRAFLSRILTSNNPNKAYNVRLTLATLNALLSAIGAALGYVTALDYFKGEAAIVTWLFYVAIFVIVNITLFIIPQETELLRLEADRLRLYNLCQRLAAEVALFDMLAKIDYSHDENAIETISALVPELDKLDEDDKRKVRNCLDNNYRFETSRGTNVTFESLLIEHSTLQQIMEVSEKISQLSEYMFVGHSFGCKIYLRAKKSFEGKSVEALVSFSKYPSNYRSTYDNSFGALGSSWIKAQGNPSIVWTCLETGNKQCVSKDFDADYKSVLSLCLPGRIGVIAITSRENNAFDGKHDEWVERSLSVAAGLLVRKSLGLVA